MSNSIDGSISVSIADIDAAARVLAPVVTRTQLLTSEALDGQLKARIFLKPEVLQRTGSFKFRGAYNKLASLSQAARAAGVVAFSSGNHAQGVALAARLLGMPATIVMPADAPALKRQRTAEYGATVVLYDRYKEDREAIARKLCDERGATLVPPFDDPKIIAGQGTVGREIAEDLTKIDMAPDIVMAPASGGGLVAGIGLAVKSRFPKARIFTAEPSGFDDHARSLIKGEREANAASGSTICDALMAPTPGEITFPINQQIAARGVTATDQQVLEAMRFAFLELKLVVEPGGAAALAALLAGQLDVAGKTVVVVLSGGNVDPALFARAIGPTA
jgi:threonine dehydratase